MAIKGIKFENHLGKLPNSARAVFCAGYTARAVFLCRLRCQ